MTAAAPSGVVLFKHSGDGCVPRSPRSPERAWASL